MNYKIITHDILNEETGEIETKDFKEVKISKGIKGGWRMVYKSYDEVQIEVLRSSLDIKIFVYIRDKFTYKNTEIYLSPTTIAEELNTTHQKVSTLIKKLIKNNFLFRIERGIYRLNPFMFLPYKADAKALQKEWRELEKKHQNNKETR